MKRFLDAVRIGPADGSVAVRLLRLAACLLIGGFFIRAALPKIRSPKDFAFIVFSYDVLPDAWVNLVAHILPCLELVCGAALILLPAWRTVSALLIGGLLVSFIAMLVSVILRGIEISCGCLSVDAQGEPIGWNTVIRNVILLACTLLAVWTPRGDRRKRIVHESVL